MTENPATESLHDDRDGLPRAPGYQPARYAQPQPTQPYPQQPYPQQPYPQQPYRPQPPPMPAYPPAHGPRAGGSGPPGMLASSADRERAIDVCKASYGEGRLTKEEFDARVHQVTSSRTYGDLAAVICDLPAGPLGGVSHYQAGGYSVPVPGYPSPVRPTNGMAIGSLVCALIGFSLPAVIMGHVARAQVRARNEAGDGLAVAGLVIGWIGTALWTLVLVVPIALVYR